MTHNGIFDTCIPVDRGEDDAGDVYKRQVMEQSTPPLFEVGADGAKTLVPNPTIQIIGRPETEVVTTGKLQISKKDFTNLTNRAAALLELFLHGFMQERKEMEAAQND